jgi:hypothetical protein
VNLTGDPTVLKQTQDPSFVTTRTCQSANVFSGDYFRYFKFFQNWKIEGTFFVTASSGKSGDRDDAETTEASQLHHPLLVSSRP